MNSQWHWKRFYSWTTGLFTNKIEVSLYHCKKIKFNLKTTIFMYNQLGCTTLNMLNWLINRVNSCIKLKLLNYFDELM